MVGYFVHVKLIPWMVVICGGLVAEVSTTEAVSQSGFWFALAGVIGAIGALIQRFMDDRQKARDYDLAKRRLDIAAGQNRRANLAQQRYIVKQHDWWVRFVDAMAKESPARPLLPTLPPLPVLPEGYEAGDQEFPDA